MENTNGGPAFPIAGECCGMTIRQWYAGMALQGELASQNDACGFYTAGNAGAKSAAKRAFEMADAMILAEKPEAPRSNNGANNDAVVEVLIYAERVMDALKEYGPSIVPHLMDSDDNDGERLRKAIAKAKELIG